MTPPERNPVARRGRALRTGILLLFVPLVGDASEDHLRALLPPMVDALRDQHLAAKDRLDAWFAAVAPAVAPDAPSVLAGFRVAEERERRAREGRRDRTAAAERRLGLAVSDFLDEAEALRVASAAHRREREGFAASASRLAPGSGIDRRIRSGVAEVARLLETMVALDRARPAAAATIRAAVTEFNAERDVRRRELVDRAAALRSEGDALESWSRERAAALEGMQEQAREAANAFEGLRAQLDRRREELEKLVDAYNREATAFNRRGSADDDAGERARLARARTRIEEETAEARRIGARLEEAGKEAKRRDAALRTAVAGFTGERERRERRVTEEARELEKDRAELERWSRAESDRLEAEIERRRAAGAAASGAEADRLRPDNRALARRFGPAYAPLFEAARTWLETGSPAPLYREPGSTPRFLADAPDAAALYDAVARVTDLRKRRAGLLDEVRREKDRIDAAGRALADRRSALVAGEERIEALRRRRDELRDHFLADVRRDAESRARRLAVLGETAHERLAPLVALHRALDRLVDLELTAAATLVAEAPDRARAAERYRAERRIWTEKGREKLAKLATAAGREPPPTRFLGLLGDANGRTASVPAAPLDGRPVGTTRLEGAEKRVLARDWFATMAASGWWSSRIQSLRGLVGDTAQDAERRLRGLFAVALEPVAVVVREAYEGGRTAYRVVLSGRAYRIGPGGALEPVTSEASGRGG